MDHLEACAWVARDRGCEPGGVTLRPKDGRITFTLPEGGEEVMSYDQLVAEGEWLRAQAQGAQPGRRWQAFSFVYARPNSLRVREEAE